MNVQLGQNWIIRCKHFAQDVIDKEYKQYDLKNSFPATIHKEARQWKIMDQDFPEDLGGGGLPDTMTVKGAEILASFCAPSAFTLGFNRGALHPILMAGTQEQKQRFVGRCIDKGEYASLCLTEPKLSGSNLMNLNTIAQKTDRGWSITGEKTMVGNGGVSHYFMTLAKTIVNGQSKGLNFFVIPRGQGVHVGPNTDKIGFRCVETPSIKFNEVEIPDENLIGELGQGSELMKETLDTIRVGGAAVILGIVKGSLKDALPWVEEREVYGGRLIQKSHIQLKLGAIYADLLSIRREIQHVARLRQEGLAYGTEASIAKLHASKLALKSTEEISQMFGWRGIDNSFPIQKRFRDARQTSIFEGTTEIQQLNLFHRLWKNWREEGDI